MATRAGVGPGGHPCARGQKSAFNPAVSREQVDHASGEPRVARPTQKARTWRTLPVFRSFAVTAALAWLADEGRDLSFIKPRHLALEGLVFGFGFAASSISELEF